jgi:rSAM/selenodomain-associated transferase 1
MGKVVKLQILEIMNKNLLIIFTKNPEKGKVKTRLANTIGDDKALIIYKKLLHHTANFCENSIGDKWAFYSNKIGDNEYFDSKYFDKHLQHGGDLGEKMKNAFIEGFKAGYKNIIVIGSDCYDLNTEIINTAFDNLNSTNFTIGPALDGGYYLLGMNTPFYNVFENKSWSTESVFNDTVNDIKGASLTYCLLPKLSDIDYEEDLGELKKFI